MGTPHIPQILFKRAEAVPTLGYLYKHCQDRHRPQAIDQYVIIVYGQQHPERTLKGQIEGKVLKLFLRLARVSYTIPLAQKLVSHRLWNWDCGSGTGALFYIHYKVSHFRFQNVFKIYYIYIF